MASGIVIRRRGQGNKTVRLEIRCRQETYTRFHVYVANEGVDQETFLNRLIDFWRLTHMGTVRPMPGKTFGGLGGGPYRP